MSEENAAQPPQQAQSESPAPSAPAVPAPSAPGAGAPMGHSGPPSGGPGRFGGGGHGGPRPQGGGGRPGGGPGGPKRGKRSFVRKKKVCRFCVDKADFIDYKRAAPALADGSNQAGAEYRASAVRRRAVAFGLLL